MSRSRRQRDLSAARPGDEDQAVPVARAGRPVPAASRVRAARRLLSASVPPAAASRPAASRRGGDGVVARRPGRARPRRPASSSARASRPSILAARASAGRVGGMPSYRPRAPLLGRLELLPVRGDLVRASPAASPSPNTCGCRRDQLGDDAGGDVVDAERRRPGPPRRSGRGRRPAAAGRRAPRAGAVAGRPVSTASITSWLSSSRYGSSDACVCSASHGQPPGERSRSITATRSSSRAPGTSWEPVTSSTSGGAPSMARPREQLGERVGEARVAVGPSRARRRRAAGGGRPASAGPRAAAASSRPSSRAGRRRRRAPRASRRRARAASTTAASRSALPGRPRQQPGRDPRARDEQDDAPGAGPPAAAVSWRPARRRDWPGGRTATLPACAVPGGGLQPVRGAGAQREGLALRVPAVVEGAVARVDLDVGGLRSASTSSVACLAPRPSLSCPVSRLQGVRGLHGLDRGLARRRAAAGGVNFARVKNAGRPAGRRPGRARRPPAST